MTYIDFVGHYCPRGTMSPTQFPCVEGSWTNLTNLISQEECYVCPKGYFCLRGVSTPSGLCFTGHYCPRGMFKNSAICIHLLGQKQLLFNHINIHVDQHLHYPPEALVAGYKSCWLLFWYSYYSSLVSLVF